MEDRRSAEIAAARSLTTGDLLRKLAGRLEAMRLIDDREAWDLATAARERAVKIEAAAAYCRGGCNGKGWV